MGAAISKNGQPRRSLHKVDTDLVNIVEDGGHGHGIGAGVEDVVFKVGLFMGGETAVEMRKLHMSHSVSLDELSAELRQVFVHRICKQDEFSVVYRDDEGDLITLGTDAEFRVYLQAGTTPVKIDVRVATLPTAPAPPIHPLSPMLSPTPSVSRNIIVSSSHESIINWNSTTETVKHIPEMCFKQTVTDNVINKTRYEDCEIKWKTGKQLGRGASGQVHLAINTVSGRLMAVKRITLCEHKDDLLVQLNRELNVLRDLSHPRLVRYLGCVVEEHDGVPSNVDICMEYVSGGSIAQTLQQFGPLGESIVKRFTSQILEGLVFLHSHSIVHRDVKGANVLLTDQGEVKLADFGSSKCLQELKTSNVPKGTVLWMAPESFCGEVSTKSDIWSLGCTIIEMATGSYPWSHFTNEAAAMYGIKNTKKPPKIPESFSREGADFLRRCFAINPDERPSAASLLEHPFIISSGGNFASDPFTSEGLDESLLNASVSMKTSKTTSTTITSPPAERLSFHDYARLRPSSAPSPPKMYLNSIPVKLMDTYIGNKT